MARFGICLRLMAAASMVLAVGCTSAGAILIPDEERDTGAIMEDLFAALR
jgi:hypothetical protein